MVEADPLPLPGNKLGAVTLFDEAREGRTRRGTRDLNHHRTRRAIAVRQQYLGQRTSHAACLREFGGSRIERWLAFERYRGKTGRR